MQLEEVFPDSPFEPTRPVSPRKFKGRLKDTQKILRQIPRTIHNGMPEHFFITGKKGMGKTSFVRYVARQAEDDYQMIPVYLSNDKGNTLDELIRRLLEALFREIYKESWGEKLIELFVDNIQEIKIGGSGFSLKDNQKVVENIKKNFVDFMISLCKNLHDKKGVFIVIDDINGLSNNVEFTDWYKGVMETLLFQEYDVPVIFTLISYPNEFDNLVNINESFARMFQLIEIDNLDDKDIAEFFKSSFEEVGIEFEDEVESLHSMIFFSYGMPLIMQQIGDSIFFFFFDTFKINENIVYLGIAQAADELGNKQLKSKLNKIRSDLYISIFLKLGKERLLTFHKSDVKELLSPEENRVFNDFLIRAKDLGILESMGRDNSGEYGFVNRLYIVYFMMLSAKENYEQAMSK